MSPDLRRAAALVAVFCWAPIAVRGALLVNGRVVPATADAHGVLVDLFVGLTFAAMCAPLFVRARYAGLVLIPWTLVNYASFEFTKTMNAVPPWQSFRFLGDRTFVGGSALVVSNPVLFIVMLGVAIAFAWSTARRYEGRPQTRVLLRTIAPPLAIVGMAAIAWPTNRELLDWRQTNVIASNAVDMLRPTRAAARSPLDPTDAAALDRLFRVDLGGAPIVPAVAGRPNVLLVLLESVCGTDLPSVAELQKSPSSGMMPKLDAIGRDNLYFRSFLTHQRGTNRGLYSTLCGNYPKLSTATAKMTELASGPDLTCLPAVLRDRGYATVFLQAAPLAFMMKDAFMPKAGFTQTLGAEQFTKSYARNFWGVDDRAFFEKTREKVRELRSTRKPWMMTVLTVGTHHPYAVPDDFVSREPVGSYARAARYADGAVAELVEGLEEDGVLDDTIVLITSDEARGLDEGGDDLARVLTQNLSFLIALIPSRQKAIIDDTFVQSETAASILDIAGLGHTAEPFVGRSIFRRYDEPRRLFVANQYTRTVGMIDSSRRRLWTCDEKLVQCDYFQLDDASLVSPSRRRWAPAANDVALLRAAQERAAGTEVSPYREISLTSDQAVEVVDPDYQLLYAGQYVYVPAGAAVDVDIKVMATGEDGEISLSSDLVTDGSTRELARPAPLTLRAGQAATLRYSFRGSAAVHGVEARAIAKRLGAAGLSVRFTVATMRIRLAGWGDRPGTAIHERAVSSAAVD